MSWPRPFAAGTGVRIVAMSIHFSADEPRQATPRRHGDPVACERCAAGVELLTVLPGTVDHSAYRIFACTACNFVQWIPD
jgi:hypothetical protein